MRRFSWLVFSNCAPEHVDEFNAWYDEVHLPDLLRVPGIIDAYRLKLAAPQTTMEDGVFFVCDVERNGVKFKNLAIYEFETEDAEGILHEVVRRAGTPDMEMSATLGEVYTVLYERR